MIIFVVSAVFAPLAVAHAQFSFMPSLKIPDCGSECNFSDFIILIQNVITFILLLSFPISVIAFTYAGFLILTANGNSGKVDQAKEIFIKVVIGLFFALTAWLIVRLITTALLKEGSYEDLLKTSTITTSDTIIS